MTDRTPNLRTVRDVSPSLHYRTIHGYRRAYRIAGSGPAILLIHGIGDNSTTWSTVQTMLAQRFTVIAPDLLGHGKSDKPRADYSVAAYANGMRDLLSVLDVERVTVVGHSLGGGVAMQFAYQFPEMVERIAFVAPGGVDHDVSPLLRLLAPFQPFATEEVWSWWRAGSVHTAAWPGAADEMAALPSVASASDAEVLPTVAQVLGGVRKAKSEAKVKQRTEVRSAVVTGPAEWLEKLRGGLADLKAAGNIAELTLTEGAAGESAPLTVSEVELAPAEDA